MQLQKEISTSGFENERQQAIVNIVFTFHWCNDKIKQAIAPYEVTPQQFNILRILRGQYPKPCTINLLKSRMLDKMCDASRIVDRLMQKDLVRKAINSQDKRSVDILISDKGLSLLKTMDQEVDITAIISPNLTIEESEQLNLLLDKLRG
ncbi:MarR family winged helix-turn-helix transcriptional regulator [Pedobacter duraquae]|uniref:DNA-binding MarR family transcriptional regulator n=1 Tax=Pedobacter duraquae TaxID=425511 RepID=A0A4R6IQT8_9SPHI|nr:MarR family transcriptional regulator [Pedobacter duraquae]TDO24754.1 DNA-binding MarR family transcriptional regulator [Pedobacter duraquae]